MAVELRLTRPVAHTHAAALAAPALSVVVCCGQAWHATLLFAFEKGLNVPAAHGIVEPAVLPRVNGRHYHMSVYGGGKLLYGGVAWRAVGRSRGWASCRVARLAPSSIRVQLTTTSPQGRERRAGD